MQITSALAKAATVALLMSAAGPAVAAGMTGHTMPQRADSQAYRFELVGAPRPLNAKQRVVSVRLVHAAHNTVMPGASFTQIRLDMSPDKMADMTAPAAQVPSTTQGIFSFAFDNSVWAAKGHWALFLTAKIKGDARPIVGRVVFQTGL